MDRKWKLPALLYAGLFAVLGGVVTFQVVAFDGDLAALTVLWWLALPLTPIIAWVTVFLTVFLGYAWGDGVTLVVMTLLCGLLFFAAGLIQSAALHGIVRYVRHRNSE